MGFSRSIFSESTIGLGTFFVWFDANLSNQEISKITQAFVALFYPSL